MTFSQMINSLTRSRFKRQRWPEGTYIYYGYLPSDLYESFPCILFVRPCGKVTKFMITDNDKQAKDWEEC